MTELSKIFFRNRIFLLVLLINIIALIATLSNTYTDGYNLRQAQTAIMSRNIFYDNFNIFPTRLTFFAPSEGQIIFEFPFIHFLTALTYKIFPISEINGRIINLFLYVFNGILFFRIQKIIFTHNISILTSSLFISSPLILYLGHAYMPETSMMTFYLLSYYFFIKNKKEKNIIYEYLMFISLALAPLLKPPAGIIYLPIFLDYLNRLNIGSLLKRILLFLFCTLPLFIWMLYANTINSSALSSGSNYGDWINLLFGPGSIFNFWVDLQFYKNILSYFILQHLNPITFIFSILAIFSTFKSKDNLHIFHRNWILMNLLFLFIFAGANNGHPYYQIYFMPPLLYFIGIFFSNSKGLFMKKNKFINLTILLNIILCISVFIYGSNEKLRISNIDEFKSVYAKNIIIDKNIPSEFILYSHDGLASTAVYTYYGDSYSKQFSLGEDDITNLQNEISLGAKYIFFINTNYGDTLKKLKENKKTLNWLKSKTKIYESNSMILYKLN